MNIQIFSRTLAAFASSVLLVATSVSASNAQEAAKPAGEIILTISGNISATGDAGGSVKFDLAALDAMPQSTFSTSTIWTNGTAKYSGVELKAILDKVGAKGKTLHMIALNDYAVDVPASEAVSGGPILATRTDGQLISVRDKGPVWLIYPFDSKPEYRTEVTYSHAIWQLKAIEVRD